MDRWLRTIKDQWMAALDMRDFHSLEKLRGSLYSFVQQYNQSPILPSADCPHRTVSFRNRSRSSDFLRKTSPKLPSGDWTPGICWQCDRHRPDWIRSWLPFCTAAYPSVLFPGYERDLHRGIGWNTNPNPTSEQNGKRIDKKRKSTLMQRRRMSMDYTARFCNKKTIDLSHRGGVFMLKHMGNRTFYVNISFTQVLR